MTPLVTRIMKGREGARLLHWQAQERAANSLALEYIKRLGHYVRCEMSEVKPARADLWAKHPAATKVLLDPAGKSLNSSRFTDLVSKAEQQARDLVFVVGGADRLPRRGASARTFCYPCRR